MATAVETRTVAARLPVAQAEALEALARGAGMNVSDVLRRMVGSALTAKARKGDLDTSHEAARTVRMGRNHAAVLEVLRDLGPVTDEKLVAEYEARRCDYRDVPVQSASGIRSRRAELADLGLVEARGRARSASGRRAYLWAVVDEAQAAGEVA